MTAAEARTCGDASEKQRNELHALIERKAVTDEWVRRFYTTVREARGLSSGAANKALQYLRALADKTEQPTYATPEQGDELRALIRTRVVPGPLARMWLARLDAGELTYIEADRTIDEYTRLPLRSFIAPDRPRPGTPGTDAPDGYFALTAADGHTRCYRIHTLKAGHRAVDQITGEKRSHRRRIRGWQATQILRAVAADTAGAARLYARALGRCSNCNQQLRRQDQPGYPHGYGRDCWEAMQATGTGDQVTAQPAEGSQRHPH